MPTHEKKLMKIQEKSRQISKITYSNKTKTTIDSKRTETTTKIIHK